MSWPLSQTVVSARIAVLGIGLGLALGSCSESDIRTYRAPKDPGIAASPATLARPAAVEVAPSAPELVWQAPAGWRSQPGDSVRRASFTIGSGPGAAQIAITVFPGDAGGVLANVDRWRGQAGLPPVTAAGLANVTALREGVGLHFTVVDTAGGSRRLVAAMTSWQGATWFFKLTGGEEAVDRAKPDFLAFLGTVHAP
jgi:hypothetical protein